MAKELDPDLHPWQRQSWESASSYDAFRAYQRLRNVTEVARDIGKSRSLITKWSADHLWVSRVRHMDNHVATAEMDTYADELAKTKSKHMLLTDKLLDHLDHLLNGYIKRGTEPTVRWTQAFVAATKAQVDALKLRPMDVGQEARLDSIVERLTNVLEG